MAQELFTRQELYSIVSQKEPVLFFLKKLFNAPAVISSEKNLRLEYFKEGEKASAYVERRSEGHLVDDVSLQAQSVEPPYLKPKMITSISGRATRMENENPFASGENPQARKARDIGEKAALLERQVQRTIELQCSDLLHKGEVKVRNLDNKTLREVNYNMPASHRVTLAAADRWNAATSNPRTTARNAHLKVSKGSGLTIDTCIMGSDASEAFIKNEEIKDLLKNTQQKLTDIQEEFVNMGVIYEGRIGSVDYFTYVANFKIGSTSYNVMDAKTAIYASSKSGAHVMYALPEHEQAVPTDRFPVTYEIEDPSGTIIQLHSAPLVNPNYIDGFYTAKVLT